MILTRRMTAFFFALAVANEAVWRLMSTEAWVNFKTFGLTAALFIAPRWRTLAPRIEPRAWLALGWLAFAGNTL